MVCPLGRRSWLARSTRSGRHPPAPRLTRRPRCSVPSVSTRLLHFGRLVLLTRYHWPHCHEGDWTSLDVVRIGIVGESSAPVILWIGVVPKSLSGENVAPWPLTHAKSFYDSGIKDVEVEICKSCVFKSVSMRSFGPTEICRPEASCTDPLV